MSLTIAAILEAAQTPRAVTPCPTCRTGAPVPCEGCKPTPGAANHVPGHVFVGWGIGWSVCSLCNGSGVVPPKDPPPCPCAGREAVRALCARECPTDAALRAEISAHERAAEGSNETLARAHRQARAALETERDRRAVEANTPPELRP